QSFEITLNGISLEALAPILQNLNPVSLVPTTSGARIQIEEESQIESVLAASRNLGGKLVSVQPVRQSLEELFVRETK
ncbi:MAG TPA: hypothetical protein VF571_10005, partial [Pyrinomonadaceae bacterium]